MLNTKSLKIYRSRWSVLFIFISSIFALSALSNNALAENCLTMDDKLLQTGFEKISDVAAFDSQFVMKKNIEFLSKPVESTGMLYFQTEKSIHWQTLSPMANDIEFNYQADSKQYKRAAEPTNTSSLDAYIDQLLSNLLILDFSALDKDFACRFKLDEVDNAWQIQMQPLAAALSQAIKSVSFNGKNEVSQIDIVDINDNRTVIEFTNQHRYQSLDSVPWPSKPSNISTLSN